MKAYSIKITGLVLAVGAVCAIPFLSGVLSKNSSIENELFVAAQKSNTIEIQQLLKKGVNINAHDNHGMSALSFAAGNHDAKTVKLLLANGANLATRDVDNMTPLHYAAANGTPQIVEMLLVKGADPNISDSYGRTPLFFARSFKNTESVALLEAATEGRLIAQQ